MARRTKEDANATRNSLIDAAERVFLERGVTRASLQEIAQAAGASRGAIYWHFKDKDDLFDAMMERVRLPLEQACGEFEKCAALGPLDRLRGVLLHVLQQVAKDGRTRRVFEIAMFRVEYVSEFSGVRDRRVAAVAAFQQQMADDLELAAVAQSIILPMPAKDAAVALHALLDGMVQNWILSPGSFELVAAGANSMSVFLKGLGLVGGDTCSGDGVAAQTDAAGSAAAA